MRILIPFHGSLMCVYKMKIFIAFHETFIGKIYSVGLRLVCFKLKFV